MDPIAPETEPEENLGPLEPPFNSMKFMRNYSSMLTQVLVVILFCFNYILAIDDL